MRNLHISVSQVRQWLRCPRQYQLARVLGIEPAFVPAPLAFGSAIHEALAHFYHEHMAGHTPTLGHMVEHFEAAWHGAAHGVVPLRLDEDETWDGLCDKGGRMLAAFVAAQREPPVVEAVELPFEVELHNPVTGEVLEERFVGAIDAVVREGDRSVLLEHKTAARRYGADDLRFNIQMSAYKMAARHIGMGDDVGLRFHVITKAAKPMVQFADVERDSNDEADFLATVVGVLRAIDNRVVHPIRGWQCSTCPFSHACPGYR